MTKGFIYLALLVSVAFGSGYWVAQKKAAQLKSPERKNLIGAKLDPARARLTLPPVKPGKREPKSIAALPTGKSKATIEEIEAKIKEMAGAGIYGNTRRFGEWQN
ncbi:MAG: hypothetical protein ABIQ35_06290, partial [Verrucomicrobiota bacterium]